MKMGPKKYNNGLFCASSMTYVTYEMCKTILWHFRSISESFLSCLPITTTNSEFEWRLLPSKLYVNLIIFIFLTANADRRPWDSHWLNKGGGRRDEEGQGTLSSTNRKPDSTLWSLGPDPVTGPWVYAWIAYLFC